MEDYKRIVRHLLNLHRVRDSILRMKSISYYDKYYTVNKLEKRIHFIEDDLGIVKTKFYEKSKLGTVQIDINECIKWLAKE